MIDRLRDLRNKLLADARFQHFAAAFPLTRGVAQSKSKALFDLCAGFVYSQVLSACVELELFRILGEGPARLRTLSFRTGVPEAGLERLLKAAAAIDLIDRRGDVYALGELGAALLGNPSVFAMIRHHGALYADLEDTVGLLRARSKDTRLARYWSYVAASDPRELSDEDAADYTDLMAATQAFIAGDVIRAYPLQRHRRLLDVGGGSGVFGAHSARSAGGLEVEVCDLPPVAARAQARFAEQGLAGRATATPLDFLREPLPQGADIVSLVRVLHDHDDADAALILSRARDALSAGGRLLVAEPMAGTRRAEASGDAYFGIYLWAMGAGRPRTRQTLADMIKDAGFRRVRERRTANPMLVRVLVAD
ncbi:MAG: methyltransferase [Pseudomonadota bacterium]